MTTSKNGTVRWIAAIAAVCSVLITIFILLFSSVNSQVNAVSDKLNEHSTAIQKHDTSITYIEQALRRIEHKLDKTLGLNP